MNKINFELYYMVLRHCFSLGVKVASSGCILSHTNLFLNNKKLRNKSIMKIVGIEPILFPRVQNHLYFFSYFSKTRGLESKVEGFWSILVGAVAASKHPAPTLQRFCAQYFYKFIQNKIKFNKLNH